MRIKSWIALWLGGAVTTTAMSCGGKHSVVVAREQFDLTIEVIGGGTVSSEPPLFACMGPATCGPRAVVGVAETTLTATPAVGYVFWQWEPEGEVPSTTPSITIGSERGEVRKVRATFVPLRSEGMDASVVDASREDGSLDAGAVEASVPDASADAGDMPYLAVCLSDLAGTDVSRSHRYVADVTVSGALTVLDMTLAPLNASARTLSRAQIVRSAAIFPSAALDTTNAFSHSVSQWDVAAEGNPLAMRAFRFEPFKQAGVYRAGSFCTNFAASITQPILQTVSGVCLYIKAPEGTPFRFATDGLSMNVLGRTLTRADFVCP